MRVKKVPLQDLELWPDEVICFTAYTDTRNPVQQRRTYVDGEKLKAENAKLYDDLLLAERIIGQISHEGFELIDENEKLRELVRELWEGYVDPPCEDCPFRDTPTCADCPICAREAAVINRMCELGIEVPE